MTDAAAPVIEDWLSWHAARQPDKPAMQVVGGQALTYRALDLASQGIANWMRAQGFVDGDTIALLLDNNLDAPTLWWAARRAGLYFVPLGTRLRPAELGYVLEDSGAKALIVSPAMLPLAEALRRAWQSPTHFIYAVVGAAPDCWLQVGAAEAASRSPEVVGREIIYSSGTTGRPKGIRRALAASAQVRAIPAFEQKLRAACKLDGDSIYLSVSPLYHATGRFLMRVVEAGGTAVILSHFDPEAALAAIDQHCVTHSQWVPTMFTRLLALPSDQRTAFDLSSHRVALHAAAPCPVEVKRAMIEWWGPILSEYYGGSENAGVTFITAPEWLAHPGSVGRSVTGAIHILDEEGGGRELPCGEIGLIYFEGGVPFRYINDADGGSTSGKHGYATYGDLGHLDAEGYLYISDRRSDLIIRGGVNIYPREVELVLEDHPAVGEVAVVGIPELEYGQEVKAVVVLAPGYRPDEALCVELVAYCRDRLASVKCPSIIDFVADLPRNENGKLLKRQLRDSHAALR
jgi:acyl-CoA synthetase (AMP-forming)/AMP-acid ligase II